MTASIVPIQRYTVTSSGLNTFTFSNIPQGFNDLKIYLSARHNVGGVTAVFLLRFNGDSGSSSYSQTWTRNIGSANTFRSATANALPGIYSAGTSVTASNFAGSTVYIPNYSISGKNKQVLMESTIESNATTYDSTCYRNGGQWYKTEPITSISVILDSAGTLDVGSTITLYGVGTTRNRPKASGGAITTDGSYWYHTFRTTGTSTFIPNEDIAGQCLLVAGGGSGGYGSPGGGGAGGVLTGVGTFLRGNSYTITVGAGGTFPTVPNTIGNSGQNSSISGNGINTITARGGGAGGIGGGAGLNGSSGGGSGENQPTTFGFGTYGQGFDGAPNNGGGGGAGGAGARGYGQNSGAARTGLGGVGTLAHTLWGIATGTGQNVSGLFYYGGGGAGYGSAVGGGIVFPVAGGLGGGGQTQVSGTANTGGGGGADGGAGGSGVVIIRYSV
jgi:hypothetical protein